jgi:hypothetical protein
VTHISDPETEVDWMSSEVWRVCSWLGVINESRRGSACAETFSQQQRDPFCSSGNSFSPKLPVTARRKSEDTDSNPCESSSDDDVSSASNDSFEWDAYEPEMECEDKDAEMECAVNEINRRSCGSDDAHDGGEGSCSASKTASGWASAAAMTTSGKGRSSHLEVPSAFGASREFSGRSSTREFCIADVSGSAASSGSLSDNSFSPSPPESDYES